MSKTTTKRQLVQRIVYLAVYKLFNSFIETMIKCTFHLYSYFGAQMHDIKLSHMEFFKKNINIIGANSGLGSIHSFAKTREF